MQGSSEATDRVSVQSKLIRGRLAAGFAVLLIAAAAAVGLSGGAQRASAAGAPAELVVVDNAGPSDAVEVRGPDGSRGPVARPSSATRDPARTTTISKVTP